MWKYVWGHKVTGPTVQHIQSIWVCCSWRWCHHDSCSFAHVGMSFKYLLPAMKIWKNNTLVLVPSSGWFSRILKILKFVLVKKHQRSSKFVPIFVAYNSKGSPVHLQRIHGNSSWQGTTESTIWRAKWISYGQKLGLVNFERLLTENHVFFWKSFFSCKYPEINSGTQCMCGKV